MFRLIAEIAFFALTMVALIGFFSAPTTNKNVKWLFLAAGFVAVLGLASARETGVLSVVTLAGLTALFIADLIWVVVLFGKSHNFSVFGWFQANKTDPAALKAGEQVAVSTLQTDVATAKVVATAAAGQAGAVAAGAAAKAVEGAVASGAEKAVAVAVAQVVPKE